MAGRKGGRAKRRKVCFFTANGITRIDYKDVAGCYNWEKPWWKLSVPLMLT